MSAGQKCRATEGAFTCDRAAGHYPETQHAALGLGGAVVWLWGDEHTIRMCVDCAMLAANDDDSGATEGARDRYSDGVDKWSEAVGGHAVIVVNAEESEFRNAGPCDVCGSMLGGDFYEGSVITQGGAR